MANAPHYSNEYARILQDQVEQEMKSRVGAAIEAAIAEARQAAADKVEKQIRAKTAEIAMAVMSHFDFERDANRVIITVRAPMPEAR